ncbi:MAG: cupin domain-containing protein [Actinomycetota bacterium]|nr:cupin domain-containing protein [Actinomycetota bacterium]
MVSPADPPANDPASDKATELPTWANGLGLQPHPEGGFFAETWRSGPTLGNDLLGDAYDGDRDLVTAIYYLLLPDQTSAWHVVTSPELWLYHRGGPLRMSLGGTDPDGPTEVVDLVLGAGLLTGEQPQILVPADTWQMARPVGEEPVLVSCVVAPGFDPRDFRLL